MRAAGLLALLVLVSSGLFAARSASATTYVVAATSDAPDANVGDGVCLSAGGQCTLRAAVQEANASAGADTILLPAGTYQLAIAGANENAAATGDLDITGNLTIAGSAPAVVIDAAGIDRAVHVLGGAHVTLRNLTIENGDAGAEDGGGIRNDGTLSLQRVTVRANSADDGGGLINFGSLTITDSTFQGNVADDVGGGLQNDLTAMITRTAIEGNVAPFGGGGINNLGTLDLIASTVSGNTSSSGRGAGINNIRTLTARNATVSGNTGHFSGGGVANVGTLLLEHTTIAANSAAEPGGGLYSNAPHAVLSYVLLATNVGGNCNLIQPLESSRNTFDTGPTCGFTGPGDRNAIDVQLGPLADNGGPTLTHALVASSPAVDAGDAACAPLDQRAVARPFDGDANGSALCDAGAYEYVPGPLAALGDMNCDGSINSIDVALLLQRGAQLLASFSCAARPDVNNDLTVNAIDASLVLQYVAGLLPQLPP